MGTAGRKLRLWVVDVPFTTDTARLPTSRSTTEDVWPNLAAPLMVKLRGGFWKTMVLWCQRQTCMSGRRPT